MTADRNVTRNVPPRTSPAMESGRALTEKLYRAEDLGGLFARFSPELQKAVGGTLESLKTLRTKISEQLGDEVGVKTEAVYRENGVNDYYRIARFSKLSDDTATVRWAWTEDGTIVAARISPTPKPAASEHLDRKTITPLKLPFKGTWYVAWGGREPHENYHVVAPDQRFAYDFLIMREGSSHRGDGKSNSDYHCWGMDVLAPADGTIVTAVDGIEDNVPGTMNSAAPPGNHVVIDHGNGEFSLIAHAQKGSLEVRSGQHVNAGQRLFRCGNSGRSSEPHVHYHLQTGTAYKRGVGLPAQFLGYRSSNEPAQLHEPRRGEFVTAQ